VPLHHAFSAVSFIDPFCDIAKHRVVVSITTVLIIPCPPDSLVVVVFKPFLGQKWNVEKEILPVSEELSPRLLFPEDW